jgi:hypothetical protein
MVHASSRPSIRPPGVAARSRRGRRAAVLVASAVLALLALPAAAQRSPSMRIELERPSVGVGESFDAFVGVQNVSDLGGFQFTLTYDPAVVQFEQAVLTPFMGSTGREVLELGPLDEPGKVTFGAASMSTTGQRGPDGSGDLVVLTFTGLKVGISRLDFAQVLLVNTHNERTEITGAGAAVGVGMLPPTSTPGPTSSVPATTATPSPTAPGPTATRAPLDTRVCLPWAGRP